jgi:hypothetical protein
MQLCPIGDVYNDLVTFGRAIESAAGEVPETKPQLDLFGGDK